MWSNRLFLTTLLAVAAFCLQAQENAWIDYSQEYYRIKIADNGVYRITAGELAVAGVPVHNVAFTRYQLFRKGQEVAIDVYPTENNRLDYFEFYGEKNDGSADKALYVAPEAHSQPYYSLFSDTATYFLTWYNTSTSGKRIERSNLQDATGLTPEPYHIDTRLNLQTSSYARGLAYGASREIFSPKYDFGEGWTGPNISKNQSRTYTFNLASFASSGPKPTLEVQLNGISNFEHVVDISVGPSASNLRSLGQVTFEGLSNAKYSGSLEWSDVGASGDVLVRATALGVPGQTDVVSVSHIKLDYAQATTLAGTSKTFVFQPSGAERGYVSLATTSASGMRVLDITNLNAIRSIASEASSDFDSLEFVFPDFNIARRFHIYNTPRTVGSISKANMGQLPIGSSDYLIVSHPSLDQLVDGVNPVTSYAAYRSSVAGGGHSVLVANIDALFDQFNYGDPSPLAIRNFVSYALSVGSPEYLFIIGKGTTPNHGYYRQNPATTTLKHFVPTFGLPGSDLLFSVGVQGGNQVPALGTGRLNALNSGDVKAYLDKVKEMEAQPYDQLWRKNLIHLSGGQTPSELRSFENFIRNFQSVAEGDYLGGKSFNKFKGNTDPVRIINVADEVNQGVSLITFFGHSSSLVTDIEIGRASNPADGYTNQGKYPVMLVNGCNAGEIFSTGFTFGEDWVRTPNVGAIGVIANSDFALSSSLKRWSDLFYQVAFATDETFGSSLGEIYEIVSDRYFTIYGTGGLEQSQVYQTVLQGDPAVKVFGATTPDYEVQGTETYASAFGQDRVLSNADSFQIHLVVRNYGRSVEDPLEVAIQRTLPDGSQESTRVSFPRVLREDTLAFTIYNNMENQNEGTNVFLVQLDPDNAVDELNDDNNTSTFELFIPKGNTIPLYPVDYGTVSEDLVDLLWQSANQLEQPRTYQLQVDTVDSFNSPYFKSETKEGALLLRHPVDISALPDSTTVYWRTRFAQPKDSEDTTWVQSSFTRVPGGATGWAQIGTGQFGENALSGVTYSPGSKTMGFEETQAGIQVNTHGVGSPNAYVDYQVIVDGINLLTTDNAADPTCKRLNAINAVVFDKQSALPYRPFGADGADVSNDLVCGRLPQMIHNFNQNDVLGANRYLDSLIAVMQVGDMILLFSFDSVAYSGWDSQLKTSLSTVGIAPAVIEGLTNGQPVIFLGKKGAAAGSATVVTSDGSAIPPKEQEIELESVVTGKFTSGSLRSTRIGPSVQWDSFHYTVADEPGDNWQFRVIGISPTGQEHVVFTGSRSTEVDVSQLDAAQYPYMALSYEFSDNSNQTPPTLESWGVDYQYPPEGFLTYASNEAPEVAEGAAYSSTFLFTNISEVAYADSLDVEVAVTNVGSAARETEAFRIAPPAPGDTTLFEVSSATRGKSGSNNLLVKVTPREQELYTVNNTVNRANAFSVSVDEINPVLDVTFDGGYILDGDIVSPNPGILIRFKDDNEFLYKDDTTGITVELKGPCEGCVYQRVAFTDPKIAYTPAAEGQEFEISYMPGPLEDGVYSIRVDGTDESGNRSGEYPYEVSFEVINKSSITHFYPYPNPFSTQTRFVFTLTGSTIPDRIKIQIMTVTGRVVREITQDEIGPLRIGNNITQYAWDGRDEYGDLLANGVYLYKVFLRQDGGPIEHRNTTADRAFKNGFGKLYILR